MNGEDPAVLEVNAPLDYQSLPAASRHRFAYRVSPMADGSVLSIPVLVIVGRSAHPRLVCVAGVHGDEHEGITALLEAWDELAPAALNGTVVMVPVANPPAFLARTRRNPEDMVDMNRVFPGDAKGTITHQLAHHLFHGIVAGADFLLSMHGWTQESLVTPYTEYPGDSPVTEPSKAAALAFGLEYVEAFDWPYGLLVAAATRAGIPAIEPEIGGLGITLPARRARYKQGVQNLMKHLGMLDGSPEVPDSVRYVTRQMLTAPVGGVIRRYVELGDDVAAGDHLMTITTPTGETLAEVIAPTAGFMAAQRLSASVNPGELLAVIFQPQSEGDN